jgi:superfamily II DNA or RNA helicase
VQNLPYLAYDQLDGGRLREHQAEGVALMAATPKTVCADPVGAGKTVQAAGLIAYRLSAEGGGCGRPMVWLTQGDQLAHQTTGELTRFLPGLNIQNLAGHRDLASSTKEDRQRQALAQPADVKVMTYSQWNVRAHLWDGPSPDFILDEASALKGGGKQYAVLAATATAERVHAFTATLYENDPMEVWRVYSLLHLPHLPDQSHFGGRYVDWRVFDTNTQPYAWSSVEAAHRFRELTADHYFRREHALADLDRPDYVRHDVWTQLSPPQRSAMRWATDRLEGLQRRQFHKAVITGKRSGPSTRALKASQLLQAMVVEDPTAKVLVIAESLDELDTVAQQLKAMGIGFVKLRGETDKAARPGLIEDFRTDPDVSILLGSKVVERGLNLQFCRHLVSIGLPDNPARLDQGAGRIVRHGSPFAHVDHWVVLNDHEYDRKAVDRLARKEAQAALLRMQTA